MVNERRVQSRYRHFRWLPALLVLLLGACGGNTSVYFCSGTDEFCSGLRDREEDEDKTAAATAQALSLARKTPRLIEAGLETDQLRGAGLEAPGAVGGWLLLSSLGVIVDDGDNAALSGFFDRVRVWLAVEANTDLADPVLAAGMALLAQVASERDPAVAEALRSRLEGLRETPMMPSTTVTAWPVASLVGELDANAECCSERALAAASVVLCRALEADEPQACAIADGWLTRLREP